MSNTHEQWLDTTLANHRRLTDAVVQIVKNVLHEGGVDYLAVTGRTKDRQSALEKIKRKAYADPAKQMTDLSGIRIVVFIEAEVEKVSALVRDAFRVDEENSANKDAALSANEIGYRSVHFVCDLGPTREALREHRGLAGLKFEFQVRTVLQHAWAEMAHDRSYKFSGRLPHHLQRKLFLYAGLLEIADRGFNELAHDIDEYAVQVEQPGAATATDAEVSTLSLSAFVDRWAKDSGVPYQNSLSRPHQDLFAELSQFGIKTIADLAAIIPKGYADALRRHKLFCNTHGLVRDWMVIHDWRRFVKAVDFAWRNDIDSLGFYADFISKEDFEEFQSSFEWYDSSEWDTEDVEAEPPAG